MARDMERRADGSGGDFVNASYAPRIAISRLTTTRSRAIYVWSNNGDRYDPDGSQRDREVPQGSGKMP